MAKRKDCSRCYRKEDEDNFEICESCMKSKINSNGWWGFFSGFSIAIFLMIIILGFAGVLDNKYDRLELDKDAIVSDYVKEYYPEFANCTIEHSYNVNGDAWNSFEGANIYCGEVDSRDSMKSLKGKPDEVLIFEKGLTVTDIIEMKLIKEGLK